MRAIVTRRLAGLAAIAVAAVALVGTAAQAAPQAPGVATAGAAYTLPPGVTDPCPKPAPGEAGCAALTSKPAGQTAARPAAAASTTLPAGYGPANLQQAYGFQSARSGSGQTVAVVTAYNDPSAASDLAAYRTKYGLAPCTATDGCFRQVSQAGTSTLPSMTGWTAAAAQSIDMISAICPNCHILLVEADNPAITNLGTAENEAVTLGAKFIDNDWVFPEAEIGSAAQETSYDTAYFDHPGVAITAPAGDDGYGTINYPAASQYVTAVGGTTLTAASSALRGYTESAWAADSSGCSAYEPKPSWQTDTGCAGRTVADLAADADPNTPVAYYDTLSVAGWGEGSGTTVAAAIIAASYALAGTPASATYPSSYPYLYPGGSYTTPGTAYGYPSGLNNITSGSDGTCAVSYLCTAGAGYNGPAGLGSPNTALSLTTTGETGQFQVHTAANICLDGEPAGPVSGITTGGAPEATAPADLNLCNISQQSQTWTASPNGTITDTINVTLDEGGSPPRYIVESFKACLDALNGTTPGSPVYVDTSCGDVAPIYSFSRSEMWTLTSSGEVISATSGLCLTDPGGATAGGTTLKLETCASSPAADQQWTAPYDRPTASGAITSQITTAHICVDDTGNATNNTNKIQVWTCNGDAAQHWAIESDGTIQINGKCLVTDGDGTSNGTKIYLYTCTGDTGQQWTERSNGSLVNTRSGTCLDDPYASTVNGTQLQIWDCNGNVQQSWTLP